MVQSAHNVQVAVMDAMLAASAPSASLELLPKVIRRDVILARPSAANAAAPQFAPNATLLLPTQTVNLDARHSLLAQEVSNLTITALAQMEPSKIVFMATPQPQPASNVLKHTT